MKKIKIKPHKMQLQNSPKDLDEVARPSLFTERIGLFAGKSHNQVILHHVVHGISLHNDISITRDNIPIAIFDIFKSCKLG